jgi:hypothetical protein
MALAWRRAQAGSTAGGKCEIEMPADRAPKEAKDKNNRQLETQAQAEAFQQEASVSLRLDPVNIMALQQTIGNQAVQQLAAAGQLAPTIQRRIRDTSATSPDAGPAVESGEALETRLNEIEANYRSMIQSARDRGYEVAAQNLEHFLAGTGGVRTLSSSWLRGFDAVTTAERTNQQRFENSLEALASQLADGETRTFNDHWDRMLTASTTTELYYASGTSTIRSTGNFTLTRAGNVITITGTVNHHWFDPYDWHAGLAAFIPGYGVISDSDALLLQQHRGAAPFDMEADWTQSVSGQVEIIDWWPDSVTFTWTGP